MTSLRLRPACSLRLLTPPPEPPRALRLTALGPLITFHGGDLTIGSDPTADLRLGGPGVAPRHCRLREHRHAPLLLDHGSPHGTAVNGRRISEPTLLTEGDRITLGTHVLEVLAARLVVDLDQLAAHLHRGPRQLFPPLPPLAGATPCTRSVRAHAAVFGVLLGLLVGLLASALAPEHLAITPETDTLTSPDPEDLFLATAPAPEPPTPFLATAPAPEPPTPFLATAPAPEPPTPFLATGSRPDLVRLRATAEDTWDSLARELGVNTAELRTHNFHLRGALRSGDIVALWLPPRPALLGQPAQALLPQGAHSLGSPHHEGQLREALRLPPHPDYDLRCPANAFASSATATALLTALAQLRQRYRGQIVVGDLSRESGGAYGPHLSHQSGRDVDLWLPILGGLYHSEPACQRCGTPWCRPEPEDVDWHATWALIDALAATGAVQQIFLDRALHPLLRAAAHDAGLDALALARVFPRRRGTPALVTHSAGHTRHLHVRFRCAADESSCLP